MRLKALLASTSLVGALALMPLVPVQAQTAAALTGQVSSAEEGMMEGVLVSAKREGSTITTTVVSNDKGQYSFPADRLEPGHYNISIRATGYVLDGPKAVDVAASGAKADVKLVKTKNLVGQLTNAEWLISAPGDDRIKSFLPDCVGCHSLQRVFTSTHDADEFKTVFTRMGRYAPESVPTHPQLIVQGGARSERPRVPANMMQAAADYLSSANRSTADQETFGLKTLPRPKGRATHVIVTEYDLARKEALPHDVIVDADGHAWYSDFGNQYVGELDPNTGKVTDYALPLLRPEQPKGSLDMEFDPSGDNIWIGMSYQAGTSVINRKTKEVKTYPLPKEWAGVTTQTNMASVAHSDVDGKLWMDDTENHHVYRLNVSTGEWENKGEATSTDGKTISGYGIPTDKFNNLYMLEFGNTRIGMLDAKTNVAQIWNTPIVRSRPRRGRFDDQGHLWFAQYGGNAIGMFDPTTQQIKEYQLPTPWTDPYDVVPTRGAAEVWTGSMLTDRVVRLNPKTDDVVEYLLPHSTNIRRVFVQETGPRPVLWVGNNHGAAIVKVEPLD
jgi:virginiamycin B lyase